MEYNETKMFVCQLGTREHSGLSSSGSDGLHQTDILRISMLVVRSGIDMFLSQCEV